MLAGRTLKEFNSAFVISLYERYHQDLFRAKELQRRLYRCETYEHRLLGPFSRIPQLIPPNIAWAVRGTLARLKLSDAGLRPQFDDIEAELTYLLVRQSSPATIVEISPCGGWSTSWILRSLADVGTGRLVSFDLEDTSLRIIPSDLGRDRWTFIKGDVRLNEDSLPSRIDYLFLDSDHSAAFADWCIGHLFPKVRRGAFVSVHDVFRRETGVNPRYGEATVVLRWLAARSIPYITLSPLANPDGYEAIMKAREDEGLATPIHYSSLNPSLFFVMS